MPSVTPVTPIPAPSTNRFDKGGGYSARPFMPRRPYMPIRDDLQRNYPGYITVDECARLAKVSEKTIRRAIDRGELRHLMLGASRLFIHRRTIAAWIKRRNNPNRGDAAR